MTRWVKVTNKDNGNDIWYNVDQIKRIDEIPSVPPCIAIDGQQVLETAEYVLGKDRI